MLTLSPPSTTANVVMAGVVRYLMQHEISDKWLPLSGDYLPALDNPVLFNLFGFRYGQQMFDGELYFALPTMNQMSPTIPSVYPRPFNNLNSGPRNLSRELMSIIPSALKAHTHAGSTSNNGAHAHGDIKANGLSYPPTPWPTGYTAPQYIEMAYQLVSIAVGHDAHGHGATTSGGMVLDAAHSSTEVEPKSYGAVLCIHRG